MLTQLVELECLFIQNYKKFKFLIKFEITIHKIKGAILVNFRKSTITGYFNESEMKFLTSHYSGLSEGSYFIYK